MHLKRGKWDRFARRETKRSEKWDIETVRPCCQNQGYGVGVEAGVGVGRSRPFSLQSESELESVKFSSAKM